MSHDDEEDEVGTFVCDECIGDVVALRHASCRSR
jgi:hypothetical protein